MFLLLLLLALHIPMRADHNPEMTKALHDEAKSNTYTNLSKATNPILWDMVAQLAQATNVGMPERICVYPIESIKVTSSGYVQNNKESDYSPISMTNTTTKIVANPVAWLDIFGDLHICKESLTSLTYDEVRAVLAIAFAQKAGKRIYHSIGAGSTAFTIAGLAAYSMLSNRAALEREFAAFTFAVLPALITAKMMWSRTGKIADKKAAQLTGNQHVIDGIVGLDSLKDRYIEKDFLARIADALHVQEIVDALTYPVRGYTTQERVDYLQS